MMSCGIATLTLGGDLRIRLRTSCGIDTDTLGQEGVIFLVWIPILVLSFYHDGHLYALKLGNDISSAGDASLLCSSLVWKMGGFSRSYLYC